MEGERAYPSTEDENWRHFSTTGAAFFSSFFQYYRQVLSVWLFMIGQLLKAWPVVAIVLGKAAIFHPGMGVESGQYEVDFTWFQLQFIKKKREKKQKMVAAEE